MSKDSNINFNSIKVRLEPISGVNVPTSPVFQFHKGAIRTRYLICLKTLTLISIP